MFVEARAIYESAPGLISSNRTIKTIARDVKELSPAIALSPVYGAELQNIAKECRLVADDLLAVLEKLKPRDVTPKGTIAIDDAHSLDVIWKRIDTKTFQEISRLMQTQQDAIDEAHARNFEWIFDASPSSHSGMTRSVEWLRSENNGYKGDALELLGTIQRLDCLPDTKVCTSSRPWTQFLDISGGNKQFLMKLEDLTRNDVHRYVFDRLFTNKRRLTDFPEDLETYFQRMIDDIPEVHRFRTALTLRIALAADGPLPLSTYYFIDELLSDPNFSLKIKRRVVTEMEYNAIRRRMTARLDGRCRGLLEAVIVRNLDAPWQNRHVDFLHRTVKDFLSSPGTESVTLSTAPDLFDPYSTLSHAFLAETKLTRGNLMGPVEDFANYAALMKEIDIEPTRIDFAIYNIEAEFKSFVSYNKLRSKDFYKIVRTQGLENSARGDTLCGHLILKEAISLPNNTEVVESVTAPTVQVTAGGQVGDLTTFYLLIGL
ncbi:hypothetical protein FHL15_010626 [Xylaria flabelliformis]|uniref:DUF7791 domain-containing protein n=1 Tax=Xylaria flabelliformis TaxID=2512241 RepID=A0A553HKN5_9PEZI|nr:hypothetical protein FHL15_010626 [Xylaria flabelliformis]